MSSIEKNILIYSGYSVHAYTCFPTHDERENHKSLWFEVLKTVQRLVLHLSSPAFIYEVYSPDQYRRIRLRSSGEVVGS